MKLAKKRRKLRVIRPDTVIESEKSREDKSRNLKIKVITIIGIVCALLLAIYLFCVYRTYNNYKVRKTIKIETGTNSQYQAFGEFVVKYSNDGISYINGTETIWNEAYEMKSPIVDVCGDYLAIADKNSNTIYIFNKKGKVGEVNTSYPIIKIEVAQQGVVAALLEEASANYIELYDKEGNLIVSHKSLLSENGFPLSFSISNDGEKMMTSYLSIKEGSTENQVIFYNFSNVGKDEVDRVVGTFNQYGETIVPAVYFVSNEDAIAIGDNVLTIYKMKEKPTIRKEIKFDKEIQKVFYNEKYVGLIFENSKGDTPYKMEVYSLSGEKIMSKEIEMNLDHVKFAGKNVLMYDDVTCELISLKGVVKFKHVFTKQLDAIVPMESTNTFLLMTKNKIEEISLRYSLKSPVTKNKQTAEE
ncbi:MAG: DUF5711 family protein [Eubacterium sp.]|uniref:DUF5711 family protein n=1 Tax=Eubacterium album TaxID=2978477 RepID=A0ABT2M5Z9_9FIRM|nr:MULTISPECIES: DUF5711 family protein [unclassified Eubacterium (in: firmicutes)]MCT7399832.1 DUF5711 family protein [Eubacterium sp. LFL-14]MEE0293727.1 DUF5711 family protein [Eubacterium sp.]RGG62347.1 hypothetical protein DWW96_12490 [Eubacterium sp. AF17-7]